MDVIFFELLRRSLLKTVNLSFYRSQQAGSSVKVKCIGSAWNCISQSNLEFTLIGKNLPIKEVLARMHPVNPPAWYTLSSKMCSNRAEG